MHYTSDAIIVHQNSHHGEIELPFVRSLAAFRLLIPSATEKIAYLSRLEEPGQTENLERQTTEITHAESTFSIRDGVLIVPCHYRG